MAAFETALIREKYHHAIEDWQKKNFPELDLLTKNWSQFFGTQTPFQLVAKIGKLNTATIEHGEFAGQPKITNAGDMVGNMFYSVRDIIRAQCSTELGSIQQHRLTLDAPVSNEAKYAILRIMAEELRHAYQMFWVLDHDETWNKPGHSDFAKETIEELLAMETGSHVLDAFNIEFLNFLDNAMFATVIDLVGKYQLEMQRIFSYAPMAQSMRPMLSEEGFHMATGRNIVKEIVVGEKDYSLEDVQKAINQWFPRGLEMFGNETGGYTAVHFSFKDKTNAQAQAEYIDEVKGIFEDVNVALVCKKLETQDRDEARKIVREVKAYGDPLRGISHEKLLHVPHPKFFRRRGLEEYTYQPFDIRGELLTENGKPIIAEKYFDYLSKILPLQYLKIKDFAQFQRHYREHETQSNIPKGGFLF